MSRVVSWFSCGIASAVATKLAIGAGRGPVTIYNCELREEHPDNARFLRDCEEWFGQEIIQVGNDEYSRSTDEVFRQTRYLVGPNGARCTAELKKAVRWEHGRPDDVVVMGYTADEQHRVERLLASEPLLQMWPILIERKLTKGDCRAMIERAGIELPEMYKLGYKNNNCIGCVKGGAGYWNKIRQDFPERFAEMSRIEQNLGRTICKVQTDGVRRRVFLSDLPEDAGNYEAETEVQCGIFCQMAENETQGGIFG